MTSRQLTPVLTVTRDGFPARPRRDEANVAAIVAAFPWSEPLVSDVDDLAAALDDLFVAANVGEDGWAARYRDGGQRSLSVGDLVLVEEPGQVPAFHQVAPCGFVAVDAPVAHLLAEAPWSPALEDAAALGVLA